MIDIITQNRKIILIIVAIIICVIIKFCKSEGEGNNNSLIGPKYRIKQYFFSYHEKEFYTNLKKILYYNYGFKYEVYPKVRLADIFEPIKGDKGEKRLRMRHVDFLIVDKDQAFKSILGIELDGNSHNDPQQKRSDDFKTNVFKECNLDLVRIPNSIANNYEDIQNRIIQHLGTPTKQTMPNI